MGASSENFYDWKLHQRLDASPPPPSNSRKVSPFGNGCIRVIDPTRMPDSMAFFEYSCTGTRNIPVYGSKLLTAQGWFDRMKADHQKHRVAPDGKLSGTSPQPIRAALTAMSSTRRVIQS